MFTAIFVKRRIELKKNVAQKKHEWLCIRLFAH